MSANVAVIYAGDLATVAEVFGEAAGRVAAGVRVLSLEGARGEHGSPRVHDLEWADGIAFGTPVGVGIPAPELMHFLEGTELLWSSGRLFDKAVTVLTDRPEQFAPDSVLHPIYDALYRWGGVIVGPPRFEFELKALPGGPLAGSRSSLPASRLRSAQYRAVRFARLAGVLAEERGRRERLGL